MRKSLIIGVLVLLLALPLQAFAEEAKGDGKLVPDPRLEDEIRQVLQIRSRAVTKEDLLKLRRLAVPGERIRSVEGLQYASELEDLDLSHNRISDVTPLMALNKLQKLDLNDNRISDVSALGKLPALLYLNISSNRVSSLKSLAGLGSLAVLQANYNRIASVAPVASMKKLDSFFAYGNRIQDLKPLDPKMNAAQNRLLRLDVRGNPLLPSMNAWSEAIKKARPVDLFYDPAEPPAVPYDIPILIDGELQPFSGQAAMIQSRAFVPMRALFERLGYEVKWNDGKIHASKPGSEIDLETGSVKAAVNGAAATLAAAPIIVKGNALVPLRFVSESAGAQIVWEPTAHAVILTTDPQESKFREGYELIRDDGDKAAPYRFVTAAGEPAFSARFITAEPFKDGLAVVRKQDGNWALVNVKGEYVLHSPTKLTGLSEGLVAFRGPAGWGYLNTAGEVVIEPDYDEVNPFHDGAANAVFQGQPVVLRK
ncbi:stalk domain-containing protein [Cohnella candidum]|uniref:Copper amine oxidase-like N-terminal domain-containing protein n=1 Tax=Cohnella candidum TaxID=2674991 RepID=A0A3G3JVJ2_9BACL|nr:stalk domain-containing protein [Cohnella candidum]AYQ72260.1 hypothetical protein EAV92_06575 [Cohnella candidum]